MKQDRASRTAEFMALFRALESAQRGSRPPLFSDRFAYGFLRPSLQAVVSFTALPFVGAAVPWLIDRRWPGARTSGIARTRLIDDALANALADGVQQVIILGAGFDCRAYRTAGIECTRVFEVDHPATLAAKRERLRHVLGTFPPHVVFVDVDFNTQRLVDRMDQAGVDPRGRTFVIWEGVTNYLTADAVDTTLGYVATHTAPGSRLLFTYIHRGVLEGSAEFDGTRHLMALLQRSSEPWTFGLDPCELEGYLAARGFLLRDDLGAAAYRARYLGAGATTMQGYEFYRAAVAEVRG